jgi:hypothetical protein
MIFPSNKTQRYYQFHEYDLLPDEVVLIAKSPIESRGELDLWKKLISDSPERVIILDRVDNDRVSLTSHLVKDVAIYLSNISKIKEILIAPRFLIDITALRHNVWAPIIKFMRNNKIECRVLYVEPSTYTRHPTPSSDTIFDLTSSFESMTPIPGFSKLTDPDDEDKCLFVTMLGFEGSRPIRLLEPLEPKPEIIPIIGVPGFNLEYPTFAVACNKELLANSLNSAEFRHAKASCPFEAYSTLSQIHEDYPEHYLYIAPVGTKPHALGAILYAIDNPIFTEILYDHPVGKIGRTAGKAIVNVYNLDN